MWPLASPALAVDGMAGPRTLLPAGIEKWGVEIHHDLNKALDILKTETKAFLAETQDMAPEKVDEWAGELAGAEWYDSGIGFAVPLADIFQHLDTLKAGKDLHPHTDAYHRQFQFHHEFSKDFLHA